LSPLAVVVAQAVFGAVLTTGTNVLSLLGLGGLGFSLSTFFTALVILVDEFGADGVASELADDGPRPADTPLPPEPLPPSFPLPDPRPPEPRPPSSLDLGCVGCVLSISVFFVLFVVFHSSVEELLRLSSQKCCISIPIACGLLLHLIITFFNVSSSI